MSGHTIVITGANRGIGLELTRIFCQRGDRVHALCRQGSDELEGLDANVVDGVEVTDPQSVRAAAARIDDERIDVLVNVAGILSQESFDELADAGAIERIRNQFEVNALGPLHVTRALADRLGQGGMTSKVVLITSRMGSIGDNGSGSMYGYRMSKAALNAAGKSLALDLAERHVAVGILHPGMVRTAMTGHEGHVDADEAAAMLAERIDELDLDNAGRFLHANGEELPW